MLLLVDAVGEIAGFQPAVQLQLLVEVVLRVSKVRIGPERQEEETEMGVMEEEEEDE